MKHPESVSLSQKKLLENRIRNQTTQTINKLKHILETYYKDSLCVVLENHFKSKQGKILLEKILLNLKDRRLG